MGVDQRGIMRGSCREPECDCTDFLLVENTPSCGYCEDPPAKHIKSDQTVDTPLIPASNSSSSSTRTSEPIQGPALLQAKKWMDVKFGWIPNAKRPTGIFYNNVLESFYKSYWPYCGQTSIFRREFILERNRRWLWEKKMTSFDQELTNMKSDNPAFAGRYLNDESNFKPNKNDSENLDRLIGMLGHLGEKVDKALCCVREEDNSLFMSGAGGKIKSGRMSNHKYNETLMDRIRKILNEIDSIESKLSQKRKVVRSIWSHKTTSAASKERKQKRQKKQNDWKIKNRLRKQLLSRMIHIFISLSGEPMDTELSSSQWGIYQLTDVNEGTLRDVFGAKPNYKDKQCLQLLMEEGCFRMEALASVSKFISYF